MTLTRDQLREAIVEHHEATRVPLVLGPSISTDEISEARADRLLAVVSALIEDCAPDAPEAVANEAAILTAGWFSDRPFSGPYESVGDGSLRVTGGGLGALRSSGALALLGRWISRRAGACEASA